MQVEAMPKDIQRKKELAGFVAAALLAIAMAMGANGALLGNWTLSSLCGQTPVEEIRDIGESNPSQDKKEESESPTARTQSSKRVIDALGFQSEVTFAPSASLHHNRR
jgi:hypothetical protein